MSREPGAGSREPGAGSREPGADQPKRLSRATQPLYRPTRLTALPPYRRLTKRIQPIYRTVLIVECI
jgi:hypothetical protein